MPSFIGQNIKDCSNMYREISKNPFRMARPMNINTNYNSGNATIVVKDMSRVFSLGVDLYKKYKETRFV